MRIGETPVHIPNTMVKPYPAWDTAPATVWESRWLPGFYLRNLHITKRIFMPLVPGGIAQLGEHLPCKQGVRGSNPLTSIGDDNDHSSYSFIENRI